MDPITVSSYPEFVAGAGYRECRIIIEGDRVEIRHHREVGHDRAVVETVIATGRLHGGRIVDLSAEIPAGALATVEADVARAVRGRTRVYRTEEDVRRDYAVSEMGLIDAPEWYVAADAPGHCGRQATVYAAGPDAAALRRKYSRREHVAVYRGHHMPGDLVYADAIAQHRI